MLFSHDTEVALLSAAALVNTGRQSSGERLCTPDDLAAFVREWEVTGRVDRSDAELAAVKSLRGRLDRVWSMSEDQVVGLVNTLLQETAALPQLKKHDQWEYHFHATEPDAPLADRLAVEAAMAIADVVRAQELDRFDVCAAADCEDVLVDLAKNRSRRFCVPGCANRTNVAAYRARRAGRAS